ncbi:MAG TPA: protein-glutamate O-methyltransferase CheR [Syntrophomonadaceae bacterium]|nr:protein-glutamate O-methyltransferase CheR [Syntrophomonadaceae bacterium]
MTALSEQEFCLFADYMYDHCGLNLKQKKHLIENRLHGLLPKFELPSFSALYNLMVNDVSGELATTIVDRLCTNHTFFMRENRHFDFFRDKVLPELKTRVRNRDLRIWSAGCSSGQEAYTLAMIIADFFDSEPAAWDTRILATDISSRVLQKAREALYEEEDLHHLPSIWRLNYLQSLGGGNCRINERLRKEVIFRRFNLLEETYPFKQKFHVIFCRNVMIYFDAQTKRELVNRFYEITAPGGYLFIGQAETLNREDSRFKYVMPAVYRKE